METAAPAAARSKLEPLLLLIVFGAMMGSAYALARIAIEGGVQPVAYTFWQCFGAGVLVLIIAGLRGTLPRLSPVFLRYYIWNGFLAMSLPMTAAVSAVPHIGAGLPAVFVTLSPLYTYVIANRLGMETFVARRAVGLGVGLVGALLIVVLGRGASLGVGDGVDGDFTLWAAIAMIAPVSLAVGNIWRVRYWPAGGEPLALAAGMLLGAAALLAPLMVITDAFHVPGTAPGAATADLALLAQIVMTAVAYLVFFQLQRIAGPVYFSQVGYVMTVVGLVWGVAVFGERYPVGVWAAVALICGGLFLVNGGRLRPRRREPARR